MVGIAGSAEFEFTPAAPAPRRRGHAAGLALAGLLALALAGNQAARHIAAPPADAMFMESLSRAQVESLVRGGRSVAIVPSPAGGPDDSVRLARMLGNALIAPAEGAADARAYARALEDAANALKDRGFRAIAFLGDSGASPAAARVREALAERLNREWAPRRVRVVSVGECCAGQAAAPAAQSAIDAAVVRIRRALGRIDA